MRRLEDDNDNENLRKNHRADVKGHMIHGQERNRHDPVEKTSKHRRLAGVSQNTDP